MAMAESVFSAVTVSRTNPRTVTEHPGKVMLDCSIERLVSRHGVSKPGYRDDQERPK